MKGFLSPASHVRTLSWPIKHNLFGVVSATTYDEARELIMLAAKDGVATTVVHMRGRELACTGGPDRGGARIRRRVSRNWPPALGSIISSPSVRRLDSRLRPDIVAFNKGSKARALRQWAGYMCSARSERLAR